MTHKHAAVTFHKSSVHMLNSAVANNVYFKILVRLVQLKENQNNCKNMYNKKNKQNPKQTKTQAKQHKMCSISQLSVVFNFKLK